MAKVTMNVKELGRRHGEAQEKALTAPVFLTDGKTDTHVLLSASEYKELFAAALSSVSITAAVMTNN